MKTPPLTLLLFEDNPGDARLIQLMLSAAANGECTVECVNRLADGLARLSKGRIDLILLDLTLPDSEGLDAFDAVHREFPDLPIIVLTGLADDTLALRAMQEGAQDFLAKGDVSGGLLHRCVRHAIERNRLKLALTRETEVSQTRERNFRNLIIDNADALLIVNRSGVVRFANPAAETLFGRTTAELVGCILDFPVAPGAASETITIKDEERAVVAEMRTVETEWEGEPVVMASLRDVTARKEAEAALRESEERFRVVTQSSHDMISEVSPEGRFLYLSPNHQEILGYDPRDLLGKSFADLVHPDDLPTVKTHLEYLVNSNRAGPATFRCRHREKGWRWIECVGRTYHTNAGELHGFSVSRDITERINLEQQLRQSQKMEAIGHLAGGIAHDFNNILTVIIGHTELLLDTLPPEAGIRENLEEIKRSGERGSALIRQLLAFSRRQILEPRVLNLDSVISGMDQMLRRLIGEDILLSTPLSPELGHVKADPGQIEQVIMNLALNARDAMPQGGKLTIETANVELGSDYLKGHTGSRPGPHVLLAVSDTGHGMDSAVQAHLFEPFFTTKEKGKGTGLGLATVYGIVKQSGGNIWVYSEVGEGTTFKIYLPRVDAPLDQPPSPVSPPRSVKHPGTVLLVEDEEGVRSLIHQILERDGYTVLLAQNGEEAIRLAGKHPAPINLLLTDVVIPGLSGQKVAEQLASSRPDMKVLYISGYTDNAIVHHGILNPGTAFLQKPFTVNALIQKVHEVLTK